MNRIEPVALTESHNLAAFSCGEPSIDRYLVNEALSAQASGEARTHVWLDGDDVVAYFPITVTMIAPRELPGAARLSDRARQIPGYLLAKMGLTAGLRGRGLGPELALDAIGMIVRAADAAGGRVIVVDSLENNKVHAFYESLDFTPLPGSYRLWMKVSTAREALRAD